MGLFGVDVSNHQTSFNFAGWDFAFLKAAEGSGFKDRMFHTHLANARKAGCIVAAYHYQRQDDAASQVANIESMVPKDIPVIIDVEDGSGSPDLTRHIIAGLRERGFKVGPLYLPRWYWDKIGRPSLHGLPALWASWYPDYVARPKEQGIAKVPLSAWNPYGGNQVAVMQFTSTPFDQNWFPGNHDQLRALLGQTTPPVSGGGGAEVKKSKKDKVNAFSFEYLDGPNAGLGVLVDLENDRTTGLDADALRASAIRAGTLHFGVGEVEGNDLLAKYGAGNPAPKPPRDPGSEVPA